MATKPSKQATTKPLLKSRTIWANISAIASVIGLVALELSQEIQTIDSAIRATGTEVDIFKYLLAGLTVVGSVVSIYARIDDRVRKGR